MVGETLSRSRDSSGCRDLHYANPAPAALTCGRHHNEPSLSLTLWSGKVKGSGVAVAGGALEAQALYASSVCQSPAASAGTSQ